ncbi:MAG: oligopeptide transporter, OPT family [Legionellales bacterium]|nr:oligopeptide transporter, OPT family [Legionellales bacterium]
MAADEQPFISAEQRLPEITLRVVVLAVLLTVVLAMANAYLALKIGLLTSAAIPAAVISMAILRWFRNSNILENNQVQTAASAGEAVAGGIVYTIPALIIINYWQSFGYWENFFIALIGGVLGVAFSIPIRKMLVTEPSLRFPEGRAIAELLKTSADKTLGIRQMLWGLSIGALIEFLQVGLKVIAHSWQKWWLIHHTFVGFGIGFSATMIGAGYLIGIAVASSIMLGAVIGWLLGVPVISTWVGQIQYGMEIEQMVGYLWNEKNRYIGIGAMLVAGVWTLLSLLKPFARNVKTSWRRFRHQQAEQTILRTEHDFPMSALLSMILGCGILLYGYFAFLSPVNTLSLTASAQGWLALGCVLYCIVVGLIFSAITGYFSGMVGVSASPGSSVIIGGVLFASLLLFMVLQQLTGSLLTEIQLRNAAAVTIIICAVITGAASIANDNIQDLKVGHLLGATPWKQQAMLLLGVTVAALVIPPVMQLLFSVYGIAGVMPRLDMDPSQSLPAPPAALMAAISQSVFQQNLPWDMMGLGMGIALLAIVGHYGLQRVTGRGLSILGMAIGMYLPLASSTPIFIGGVMAWWVKRRLFQRFPNDEMQRHRWWRRGIVFACGLVAGAALMDVVLALPFALMGGPDALSMVNDRWQPMAAILALMSTVGLGMVFYRLTFSQRS